MSDRSPSLQRQPSTADVTPPPPGAWCRACFGQRWWTERRDPKGWRCLTCHPPVHLSADAIRREGEEPGRSHADQLFRQAGLDLDEAP
jgi:hypothetical protein